MTKGVTHLNEAQTEALLQQFTGHLKLAKFGLCEGYCAIGDSINFFKPKTAAYRRAMNEMLIADREANAMFAPISPVAGVKAAKSSATPKAKRQALNHRRLN